MTDDDVTYLQRLYRREQAGERMTMEIGPYSAAMLIGAVQWVIRRRQLAEHGPDMFGPALAQLELLFAHDPEGLEFIRRSAQPPV